MSHSKGVGGELQGFGVAFEDLGVTLEGFGVAFESLSVELAGFGIATGRLGAATREPSLRMSSNTQGK